MESFIIKYTLNNIKSLEHNDPQFLALKKSRDTIQDKTNTNKNLFIFLVLQCALVSYQISGSGELWRGEFAQTISQDRNILQNLRQQKQSNTDRRYNFLTTSIYNKRIYNIKQNRLKKFDKILKQTDSFLKYQNDMTSLQNLISQTMKVKKQSKTIVFAIKMFGYTCQIISQKQLNYPIYPMSISIPIDSRIKKIYTNQFPNKPIDNQNIQNYFNDLSKEYNIPPLHLDSILRLNYWSNITKQ